MKKKINENRPLAWAVLCVVVLASVILSGGGELRSMRGDVLETLRLGTNGDGLCVYGDMQERVDCALNLATLCGRYETIPHQTIEQTQKAAQALEATSSDNTRALKQNNDALERTVEALYTEIENADLSEADRTYALSQYKEFTSRGLTITRDGYNNLAEEYNRVCSQFPANIVARISGVTQLTLFR